MVTEENADELTPCPRNLLSLVIAAGGSLAIGWLFGRHHYKREVIRALEEVQETGANVLHLPSETW